MQAVKSFMALAAMAMLAACNITTDQDKMGDVSRARLSIGALFHHGPTKHDSQWRAETRTLADVHKIQIKGPVDVDITVGVTPNLVVEGLANLQNQVATHVDGDTLIIESGLMADIDNLHVKVSVRDLSAVRNSGFADVTVHGLLGNDLLVESSGLGDIRLDGKLTTLHASMDSSGDLDVMHLKVNDVDIEVPSTKDVSLGTLNADKLTVAVRGAGSVYASGRVRVLKGSLTGSGDMDFRDLRADDVTLEQNGKGAMTVYATHSIHARAAQVRTQAKTQAEAEHETEPGYVTIHGKPPIRDVSESVRFWG